MESLGRTELRTRSLLLCTTGSEHRDNDVMAALYDRIGKTYSGRRQSDPRIAVAINTALSDCKSVLNVGAGTGSYEPPGLDVVAVEPSQTMIDQRPSGSARCVQGSAESLPFPDGSFDAVMGVMTVHHWSDLRRGLAECKRVARKKVVFLTTDMDVFGQFWLMDYFPALIDIDRKGFPPMSVFAEVFGNVAITNVPIPSDCIDGFLGAYWRWPEAYLDPLVRGSISTFAALPDVDAGMAALRDDVESGAWNAKYGTLRQQLHLDLGYRLVTATHSTSA